MLTAKSYLSLCTSDGSFLLSASKNPTHNGSITIKAMITTAADHIFICLIVYFSENTSFGISYESLLGRLVFYEKKKKKKY